MYIKEVVKESLKWMLIIGCIAVMFESCRPQKKEYDTVFGNGLLVLCEGLINMNNSVLSYYDFDSKSLTSDVFTEKNVRGLGDNAQDMKIYGSKLYIVVNNSSQVEVVDLQTGKSLQQIPLFGSDGVPRSPRNIVFWKTKAYVCCLDGSVVRIDTAKLVVEASLKAGRNPEDLCVANGKLYVSNSGGLSFPNFDKTVSVIDIATFQELKKIEVALNPCTILAHGNDDVYLLSCGNYMDVSPSLQRINTQTDRVVDSLQIDGIKFCIANDKIYAWGADYSAKQSYVQTYTLPNLSFEGSFITDNTSIAIPYSLVVNPVTKDVYIADAIDHLKLGTIYCFSPEGKRKFSFEVGINPGRMIVVRK